MKHHYFFDTDQIRYELYATSSGPNFNWLFFPGGPGADSSYLRPLIDILDLPGNSWLIDLPGNGSHQTNQIIENYDFWFSLFLKIVRKFKNPIVVGHSFGGMLPLMFTEMEDLLRGCVILNSSPVAWMEEAVRYAKQFNLPDLSFEMNHFIKTPNQKTFETALMACMPYYFPSHTLEKGKAYLSAIDFNYRAAIWGQLKAIDGTLNAKWFPQKVPTLIIGAKYDCICPFSLFKNDHRFQRENIKLLFLDDAGHCPWIENPKALQEAYLDFCALQ